MTKEKVINRAPAKTVEEREARSREVEARRRAYINKKSAEYSAAGRDIGSVPATANKARRRKAEGSFLAFCDTYFKSLFSIPFSPSHHLVIEAIETTAMKGGLQAIAMPRASGKSTLCEVGAIWSILCGHRRFVMLIGATETAAREQLENIKAELEHNELLQKDFPEALFPIAALEGINKRCQGQTANGGERTSITWTANEISLPTVKGSKIAGATIRVAGITGRVRGTKKTTADGKSLRPDYVLLDDIQTEESSKSTMQCHERLKIINSAVLGLSGARTKISAVMPCTVITQGDVADEILDRKKYPAWRGIRVKMLGKEPSDTAMWDRYEDILKDSLRRKGDISEATEFYIANRKTLDAGAEVYWEHRFNPDEASALQHAMNLRIRDLRSFSSEYQNTPLAEDYGITDRQILKEDLADKRNGLKAKEIPRECDRLVMYVDIQKEVLFYTVVAGDELFTSALIEYGTFPDQKTGIFDLNSLRQTISGLYSGSVEGNAYRALKDFVDGKMREEYVREDGARMRIERCLIDANWGESTESVYAYCQGSDFSAMLLPSHGRGITAAQCPVSRYRRKKGERIMHDCVLTYGGTARRHVNIDTNSWKSFFQARLVTPVGEKGSFTVYGGPRTNHELLADHLTSEFFIVTSGQGRTIKEWKLRPNRQRNDWFDCAVGCMVALHLTGCRLPEWEDGAGIAPISLSALAGPAGAPPEEARPPTPKQAVPEQPKTISLKTLQSKR